MLDAAVDLFAHRGIDGVSLRDVADAADVNVALIHRYVGNRDELVAAAFHHASNRLAEEVDRHPLEGQGHGPDTVMGRWVRILASLAIAGQPLDPDTARNPVRAMADTLAEGYGLDEASARIRAAQIVATALGWRLIESYLVDAAELHEVELEELRADLVHTARRLGATPWPSPADPRPRA